MLTEDRTRAFFPYNLWTETTESPVDNGIPSEHERDLALWHWKAEMQDTHRVCEGNLSVAVAVVGSG